MCHWSPQEDQDLFSGDELCLPTLSSRALCGLKLQHPAGLHLLLCGMGGSQVAAGLLQISLSESTACPASALWLSLQCWLRQDRRHLRHRLHPEAAQGWGECQPPPAPLCPSPAFPLPFTPPDCTQVDFRWMGAPHCLSGERRWPKVLIPHSQFVPLLSSLHTDSITPVGQNPPLHCSLWPGLQLPAGGSVLTFILQHSFPGSVWLSTLAHQTLSVSKPPPCFILTLQ